jgi:serine/threonine-protein kinase RsbW
MTEMQDVSHLLEERAEDLYERAPCGYLSTRWDGVIIKINGTLLDWLGYARDELVGLRTFAELLNIGGRIYYETHLGPLLAMQGSVREIAVELVRRDGTRIPALVNAVMITDDAGRRVIRTTVFDATSRRQYERELLTARQAAEHSRSRVALLQQMVAELAAAPTSADLAAILVRATRGAFNADGCLLWLCDDDGDLVLFGDADSALPDSLRRIPPDAKLPQVEVVATGELVLSTAADAERDRPELAALMAARGRGSVVFVPLSADGVVFGTVGCAFGEVDPLTRGDLALLRTLGRQAGQAVARARLYEAERQLRRRAETLQRITAALAELTDPEAVSHAAVAGLIDSREVDRASFYKATLDGTSEPEHTDHAIVLPLTVGHRLLGTLVVEPDPAHRFDDTARTFLGQYAAQCAQALERARLAEESAESRRRRDFVAMLGRQMDEPSGLRGRAVVLARCAAPALAEWATVELLDEESTERVGAAGDVPENAVIPEDLVEGGAVRAVARPDGGVRKIVLRLRARGRTSGVLVLGMSPPRHLPEGWIGFLADVADVAGLALENGRLYDQERQNAHILQQGLLAGQAPRDPRLRIVTHYRPASDDAEVGGDWYDSFPIGTDSVAIVVGDVVGRGIRAASAMGQVRSAIRALAAAGHGPAALLTRLDRFVDRFEAGRMATVAYAELELATGRLRYACAGHLPPLLIDSDGGHRFLWGGRSAPLAAFAGITDRGQDEVLLTPGSRLLLYTDGLVERRDHPLEQAMATLGELAVARRRAPLDGLLPGLADALAARQPDDVCLLGVAFGPEPEFAREVAADVTQLAPLRTDFDGWLGGLPMSSTDRDAWLLVCSETVTNAIEHGYRGDGTGVVNVLARRVADTLELIVRDRGTWREPVADPARGRGLDLVRRLMDRVEIERLAGTTVTMRRQLSPRRATS